MLKRRKLNEMNKIINLLVLLAITIVFTNCNSTSNNKTVIIDIVGSEEYNRLMSMPSFDFDQSEDGFRKHWRNYDLIKLVIPEYIKVNKVPDEETKLMHWHLGQMHASNDQVQDALSEMKLSFRGNDKTWDSYVKGTIAFIEKDKTSLNNAIDTLKSQDNQMNLQILEHMLKHFGKSYKEASNSPM